MSMMNDVHDHVFSMDLNEVLKGLTSTPRRLPSTYLYDARGEELFRQIMQLPEYYLTRAEREIFQSDSAAILRSMGSTEVDIVELGAGDGSKTALLMKAAVDLQIRCRYIPIDIAQTALDALSQNIADMQLPVQVNPILGNYLEGLHTLHRSSHRAELVVFLGSNIGNFSQPDAINLLASVRSGMTEADRLLLGVDLRKDPRTVHAAYNDGRGLTAAFNVNLITRMNRELGCSAHEDDFAHYEAYDPILGEARSYLVSLRDQVLTFSNTTQNVALDQGSVILTEISKKYSLQEVDQLALQSGFVVDHVYTDTNHWFADVMLRPR